MVVFSGEHEHVLDDKGRVVIPAMYRAALDDGVFVTRGMDECIWVFPAATWRTISSRLRQTRTFATRSRIRDRLLFPGSDITVDKQGRLAIAAPFRSHAGLKENGPVMVVGVNNRLELWNRDRWMKQARVNAKELELAMEEVDL